MEKEINIFVLYILLFLVYPQLILLILTSPSPIKSSIARATPASSPVQNTYWARSSAEYRPPLRPFIKVSLLN